MTNEEAISLLEETKGYHLKAVCEAIDMAIEALRASGKMLAYPYQTIQFEGRPDWCPMREVIRCGDCKFLTPSGLCTVFADECIRPSASDFCSYGERREP